MDPQLKGVRSQALEMGWNHAAVDMNFDVLAVARHCSAPSSPLVKKVVGMMRRQLSWQRGTVQAPGLAPFEMR